MYRLRHYFPRLIISPPSAVLRQASSTRRISLQVAKASINSLQKGNLRSRPAASILADYSVAVAMKLFQSQEVGPILTVKSCVLHCYNIILTSSSYFYCQITGGSIETVLPESM